MTFILKTLTVAILIALAETLNGIFRIRVLSQRLGAREAKLVSLLTGCTLIFALTWLLLPWIDPTGTSQLWTTGGIWLAFMLGYDLYIGRVVFRQPWKKVADDFNPVKGNYLLIGMIFLLCCPLLVDWLRR